MKAFVWLVASLAAFLLLQVAEEGFSQPSAPPDSLWAKTYGGENGDFLRSLIQTADGGFALAGATTSFGAGDRDFWLVRTDANGDVLRSHTYGGAGYEGCSSLIQTADGGFALAGLTNSWGAGGFDFLLVKTNAKGDSLWSRTFGGNQQEPCFSLIQTADGGFALAGATNSWGAGGNDFWLVRTDAKGDSLWSHTFGGVNFEQCYSIIQTADGGFALAGTTTSFGSATTDADFWLVKTNASGDSLWSRTFGGSQSTDECSSLIQTADGGFALAGNTGSFNGVESDFLLVKTNASGDSLWSHTFGGSQKERCSALIQTADGGFALAGGVTYYGAGDRDFWLVRTDAMGDSLWSRTFGGSQDDWCYSIIQAADGGFALAGNTESFGAGGVDFWLVRTSAEPNAVPSDGPVLLNSVVLYPAYPNPFNSQTRIAFSLPQAGLAQMYVYDLSCRQVVHLVDGLQPAGDRSIILNATGLPAGTYLLRFDSPFGVKSQKLMLIK